MVLSLGIIIARKNSKRLKNKNIKKLGKLKLYEYPLIAAIKSKKFDKIIISTDNKNILKEKKYSKYKNVFFEMRPSELCTDKSKAISSVLFYLEKYKPQKIALMLPTCPFRDHEDIKNAFKKLNTKTTSVISVTKYTFPVQLGFAINNGTAKISKNSNLIKGKTRSQDVKDYFHPNGGIYLSWSKSLKKNKNFFKGKVRVHQMDNIKSVDIDNFEDYQIAKLRYKNFEKNFIL